MKRDLSHFVLAGLIYAGFSVYLYQPHFQTFGRFDFLLVISSIIGAVGCFLISQRWVAGFTGSFFAGAVYGFGPYMLGLAEFHPTASLMVSLVPWLFLPAVFGPRTNFRWVRVPAAVLPFLAIVLFSLLTQHMRLFAVPVQERLGLSKLVYILAPLVMAERGISLAGFYHVPIAALVVGGCMMGKVRRPGPIVVFVAGLVLSFLGPILGVSPILWLSIATLCCSVLIGVGVQGLASAGYSDRGLLMTASAIMMAFAIMSLLAAVRFKSGVTELVCDYDRLFHETAKMYILGAIVAGIFFFTARAKLHVLWLRVVILSGALAIDIYMGAMFIVNKIF